MKGGVKIFCSTCATVWNMFDFGTTNRWQKHEEEIVQAADMVNILLEYKEEVKPISSRIRTLVAYFYINYSVSN